MTTVIFTFYNNQLPQCNTPLSFKVGNKNANNNTQHFKSQKHRQKTKQNRNPNVNILTKNTVSIFCGYISGFVQYNTKPQNNHFLTLSNLGNVHVYIGSFYNWYLSKATTSLRSKKPLTLYNKICFPRTYVNTAGERSGISENPHCGRSFSKVFSDLICCSRVIT